ncbi:MAB_1171c family putative transporter [Nocardia sp. NPDC052112]|uniref:MAB_1171c family putative transporter n=1 Tax=Nocardia sp. NPDC052112 TaxID=3155646 RepID=UPI003418A360
MTSLVPAAFGWLVLGYVGAITMGRLMLLRDTIIDQLINRNLVWSIAALLWYRCDSTPSVTSPVYALASGCVVMTTMHLYVIARYIRAETEPTAVWQRLRRCGYLAAAATVVMLLAGMAAQDNGRPVDLSAHGPAAIFGIAYAAPLAVNMVVFLLGGIHELRLGNLSVKMQLVCWILASSGGFVLSNQTLSAVQLLTGRPDLGPHLPRGELDFVLCVILNVTLLAIPLFSTLLALAGWDREGRICRRLRPLWCDLTAAVPAIVLPADARHGADPVARLFRMTVEIRDALLHLGSYLPAAPAQPPNQVESDWEITDYAHRLAYAVRARKAGELAVVVGSGPRPRVTAHDFDTEVRHLLRLARVWPKTAVR